MELFKVVKFSGNPPTEKDLLEISEGGKYRVVAVTHHPSHYRVTFVFPISHIYWVFLELRDEYR